MNGFTYHNIFETKGTEYLVIILFFLVLIPFWIYLNKRVQTRKRTGIYPRILSFDSIRIPRGLFFSGYHTWAHLGSQGLARTGIDELLLKITGSINIQLVKQPGEGIKKGEIMAVLHREGRQLEVLSPVSGTVSSVNEQISRGDEEFPDDPYREGWLYQITPSDWKKETGACFLADEAINWTRNELTRIKDFLTNSVRMYLPDSVVPVLQDGGELQERPLDELPGEVWKAFQKEFLS